MLVSRRSGADPEQLRAHRRHHRVSRPALAAASAAAEKNATDVRILDLGDLLGITDFFVLASAANDRQLRTVAEEIERRLAETGRKPRRREGTKDTGWMLLDYGDIVVHAFTEEQRAYYSLELLWSDAPKVPFDGRAAATVSTAPSAGGGSGSGQAE
ncbi:MAG: ribosome silencing factor [Euzebyaceae bacterium]|nr:ribosome silencing factor [Euzebyaceae bacterium]